MKPISLLVLPLLLAFPARAEIIGVEQFDYPDGSIAGQTGGMVWDFRNITAPVRDGTPSVWSNIFGVPTVAAGRLVTNENSALRPHNGPSLGFGFGSDEEQGSVTDGRLQQIVYHRVSLTTGGTLPTFIGLSTYDFGTERIFFGKRFGQTVFGIETSNGFGVQNSTIPVAINTTYTLVAKVNYPANQLSLFINPTLGGTEPAANAVINGYTTNNFSTGVRLGSGSGGAVTWDNLLSATTWAEISGTVVTTLADEDDGPGSLSSPADISLREAVKYSPIGSLITFDPALSGGTITLSGGQLLIDKSLTLDASALSGGMTVSGSNASRHFEVQAGKSLTLCGLTLTGGNSGSDIGGAVFNAGTLTLDRCTFAGNVSQRGGAIFNDGTAVLTHCTLTGNFGNVSGGAIRSGGSLSLTRCTLSGNRASSNGGGAIFHAGSLLLLADSIIAGNFATPGPEIFKDFFGQTPTATGVNLLSDLANSGLTAGPSVLVGAAKLSPLGYFGGPVQTLHPLIGSPAIDAAGTTNPGGTDARGFPRLVDGNTASAGAQLDIGAVEAGPLRTVDSVGGLSLTGLRATIVASTEPGARIAFSSSVFPATPIEDIFGELGISAGRTLFIDASNLTGPVTISGRNTNRVFNIPATATVAMYSLKIVNGRAPDGVNGTTGTPGDSGGGILNAGALSLFSTVIDSNRAGNGGSSAVLAGGTGGAGGGISNSGKLALTACTVSLNTSGIGGTSTSNDNGGQGGGGGGISHTGSALTLTDCMMSFNRTSAGGSGTFGGNGGHGGGISSSAAFALTNCTLSNNATGTGGNIAQGLGGGDGGGISSSAPFSLTRCTLAGNRTAGGTTGGEGGAIKTVFYTGVPYRLHHRHQLHRHGHRASWSRDYRWHQRWRGHFGQVPDRAEHLRLHPRGRCRGQRSHFHRRESSGEHTHLL